MYAFALVSIVLIVASAIINRKKTLIGLRKGLAMMLSVLPTFLTVLVLVAVALYFISPEAIQSYLGKGQGFKGILIGAGIGSVALMPGFIAFPLAAVLLKQGASVVAVAAFITTLMMVGVVTLPIESKYLGWKAALIRNFLSFIGAVIVALLMGLTYAC